MKEIEESLLCELSDEEVQSRAQQLGEAVVEQDSIEARRSEASKAFRKELEEVGQRMRVLSRSIRTRSERRLVRCAVTFHTPNSGIKRIVRLDTGELCREESMTLEECQQHLFGGDAAQ